MFPQNNLVNLSKGLMIVPGKKKERVWLLALKRH